MATITTNTFLDSGTARTAGEVWTMNGGVLTVRTDTRWHSNSPASMTGSLGSSTISATLGGGLLLDGRNVRCLAFNSGGGIVPAIGTTITQGGVSGYLLGVYADWQSAPTTVGAAMPTTGFIKFREVTGGSFSAGALTGITANAIEQDKVGWIEVVFDQATAITVPRLGFFRTRGDWFELGTTNGTAGQIFQIPTNGGGVGTHVPAIWIETAPGSNIYEIYPALLAAAMITANLSSDIRSKFVETMGNGQVRIGNNGTVNVGYVPLSGCKVRIPNVFGRQSATATRASNSVPHTTLATRPDFVTTSAGEIDLEYFLNDWYYLFTSAYKVRIINGATFDIHSSSNEASPTEIDNFSIGNYLGAQIALTLTTNLLGGTIKNSKFNRVSAASSGHACSITTCSNYEFDNCDFGIITYARSTGYAFVANQCRDFLIKNHFQTNGDMRLSTCSNFVIESIDHTDRFVGTTNATTPLYVALFNVSSDNIKLDGITFGKLGAITQTNCYNPLIYTQNSSNIIVRNGGTRTTPLSTHVTNKPSYIYQDAGVNDTIKIQRIYCTTRTNLFVTVNTSKNILLENIHGTVGALQTLSLNTIGKGLRATSVSITAGASVYGTHCFDTFTSDTLGVIWVCMNEPTSFSNSYITTTFGIGAGFTSGGQVSMPNIGDQLVIEFPYYIKGHDSFRNLAPTLTGTNTGNFTYEYDFDDGTGFTGSYQTLNGTNLSVEPTSPSGFKIKIRITTSVANSANALTYIQMGTNTSLASQESFLHDLDYTSIKLTNLVINSRVQLYDVTNDVELYNEIVSGTELNYSTPYTSDFDCRVRVMYQNGSTTRKFIEFEEPVTIAGLNRSITQEIDTIYVLNLIDGGTVTGITINDSLFLVNVDRPTLSLQELYAFETAWLYTEEGIRDEIRFITAIDQANYVFEGFKIKNISSPSVPLIITGGYMKDSITEEAIDVIDTTGGTIFLAPEHVVPFSTSGGGGGDTKEDIYTYFTSSGRQNTFKADITNLALETTAQSIKTKTDTLVNYNDTTLINKVDTIDTVVDSIKTKVDTLNNTDLTNIEADLEIINQGVKKASILIPHNTNL